MLEVTKNSLFEGIKVSIEGNTLGDIGLRFKIYAESYMVIQLVRELIGHGIGKNLHESPEV